MLKLNSQSEEGLADTQPVRKKSNTWWQWMLIYPTLLITIISSVPTYAELFRSFKYGVPFGQSISAGQQNELWNKNLTCPTAPFDWYVTEYNFSVDATICRSGDILVRVKDPKGKTVCTWIPVDGLIQGGTTASLISDAYAAEPALSLQIAQSSGNVICQRFISDGRLLRRIQTSGGCFDEIVNTYTGEVIQRNPAPCDPNC